MTNHVHLSVHLAEAMKAAVLCGDIGLADSIRALLHVAMRKIAPDEEAVRNGKLQDLMMPIMAAGAPETWALLLEKSGKRYHDMVLRCADPFQFEVTKRTLQSINGSQTAVAIVDGRIAAECSRLGGECARIAIERGDVGIITLLALRDEMSLGWFIGHVTATLEAASPTIQAIVAMSLPLQEMQSFFDHARVSEDLFEVMLAGLALRPGMKAEVFARHAGAHGKQVTGHVLMAHRARAQTRIEAHLPEALAAALAEARARAPGMEIDAC